MDTDLMQTIGWCRHTFGHCCSSWLWSQRCMQEESRMRVHCRTRLTIFTIFISLVMSFICGVSRVFGIIVVVAVVVAGDRGVVVVWWLRCRCLRDDLRNDWNGYGCSRVCSRCCCRRKSSRWRTVLLLSCIHVFRSHRLLTLSWIVMLLVKLNIALSLILISIGKTTNFVRTFGGCHEEILQEDLHQKSFYSWAWLTLLSLHHHCESEALLSSFVANASASTLSCLKSEKLTQQLQEDYYWHSHTEWRCQEILGQETCMGLLFQEKRREEKRRDNWTRHSRVRHTRLPFNSPFTSPFTALELQISSLSAYIFFDFSSSFPWFEVQVDWIDRQYLICFFNTASLILLLWYGFFDIASLILLSSSMLFHSWLDWCSSFWIGLTDAGALHSCIKTRVKVF